jgi:hypothetical protein
MSKRYILDDSDSEFEDGKGGGINESVAPSNDDDFFTDEEKNAINRCQIQINNNGGIYSHDNTLRAIEKVGMSLLEKLDTGDGDGGHRYCVKVGSHINFFERDIYKVHDPTHGTNNASNLTFTEEAILLEIEALRQSGKATKNSMFKQKETGAMVVFGPWFNYAFQRLLQLTSTNNSDSATMASLMGEYTAVKIIRSLFSFITDDLKDIVKYGRLNDLKTKMGVDWLKNVGTARKVINHCGNSANFLHDELVKVEAHVQSLMSKSTKFGEDEKPVTSLAPAAAPVETLSDPLLTDTTMEQVHLKQEEAPQDKQMIAQQKRMAAMKAQLMAVNSVAPTETSMTVPSVANVNQNMEQSNIQSSVDQSHIPPQSTVGANSSLGGPSNGWGRVRDGSQETQPYRTKLGSWEMSMRILGTDIPVEPLERKLQGTSLQQELFVHPDIPHNYPSRSDDHDSSRIIPSGRFEDRSRSGNSRDYNHRGDNRRENYPTEKRSLESSRDCKYNGQNGQGVKHSRSNDFDDRGAQPEKRRTNHGHDALPERSAPVTASRNGVGRGRDATGLAWVTQQTTSNQIVGHVPGPSPHSNGQGRGRGRGANRNLPAWMTANNP